MSSSILAFIEFEVTIQLRSKHLLLRPSENDSGVLKIHLVTRQSLG